MKQQKITLPTTAIANLNRLSENTPNITLCTTSTTILNPNQQLQAPRLVTFLQLV